LPTVVAEPELATATRRSVREAEMRRRVAAARVGYLATVRPDGNPHLVPICFTLLEGDHGDVIVSGTDEKPKTTYALRRLRNIAERPAVTLLVEHYEEEWTRVWWVRVDGRGRVIEDGPERERAIAALREKYEQYEHIGLPGAVLAIDVDRWVGWAYDDG
jgi:PPOX class probable F420-dependent enzyme